MVNKNEYRQYFSVLDDVEATATLSCFKTYRSTSQMRRGEKFSQHAVPVTKELHTQRKRVAVTHSESTVLQKVFQSMDPRCS